MGRTLRAVSNFRNLHKQFLVHTGRLALVPRMAGSDPHSSGGALPFVAMLGDRPRDENCQDGRKVTVFRYETGPGMTPWGGLS